MICHRRRTSSYTAERHRPSPNTVAGVEVLGQPNNKRTNERTNEQTNEQTNERTNDRTNERTTQHNTALRALGHVI